ncbi:uncharacterized protein [Lepeophtheirus salmonis]|uniref:uncharacterized protein isoform X1 n=1 Tax=Lepeophtheirus salmonis TaxID=72036 RepID=UPI001AE273FE|nr:uncharacterized protein LOC121126107 isoform X1 [Lepeophtheirus salmonis]
MKFEDRALFVITMSSSSLSTEEDLGPNRSSNKVRKLWKNVQMRFLRYGLVEVDGDHPQYILLECIRLSLHQHLPKVLSSKLLNESHYSEVKIVDSKLQVRLKRKAIGCKFSAYAPTVFETLQTGHGIKKEDFINSISPIASWIPYYQHKSNSKGKHLFFFTNDKRYLIKFEKEKNVHFFRSHIEEYVNHFIMSPHSLIVKILGLYTIRLAEQSKPVHFIIMQSIFWPENGLNRRYDLKGCLAGRCEQVPSGVRRSEVVFKDKNFYGTGLRLGNQRSWFVEQLSRDVEFLQRLDIMDYSLLVGICKESEGAHGESLAELVSSIRRSTYGITQAKKSTKREDEQPQTMSAFIDEFVEFAEDGRVHIKEDAIDRIDSQLSNKSFLADILQETPRNLKEKLKNRGDPVPRVILEDTPPSSAPPEKNVVNRLTLSSKSNRFFQVHPAPSNKGQDKLESVSPESEWEENCRIGILESSNLKEAMNVLVRSAVRTRASSPNTNQNNKVYPLNGNLENTNSNPAIITDSLMVNKIEGAGSRSSVYLQGENRRLLPDNANGIHIIEGTDTKYFLGVIDIFKRYSTMQKFARVIKTVLNCSDDHSSAPPDIYAKRFIEFMETHLES